MDIDVRTRNIFVPHENERLRSQFFQSQQLVHYTTAENALNILKGQIWLRNARVMNDTQEIHHGFSMIQRAIRPPTDTAIEPALRRLGQTLNQAHNGLMEQAFADFESKSFNLLHRTYVTCLSIHHPETEENGRLSMWRAYTGPYAGVAIVINPEPFTQMTEDPSFFSTPVYYDTEDQLRDKLNQIAKNALSEIEFLKSLPRDYVMWFFNHLVRTIATASKHPGFKEEEEWRVMHTAGVDPDTGLIKEVGSVRGVPQIVTKLPIGEDGPFQLQGVTIPNLVQGVIIGPTNYPYVVADALSMAMRLAGIENADTKIRISKIPMRME